MTWKCYICYQSTKPVWLYPCNHQLCSTCMDQLIKCPMYRTAINRTQTLGRILYVPQSDTQNDTRSNICKMCDSVNISQM